MHSAQCDVTKSVLQDLINLSVQLANNNYSIPDLGRLRWSTNVLFVTWKYAKVCDS